MFERHHRFSLAARWCRPGSSRPPDKLDPRITLRRKATMTDAKQFMTELLAIWTEQDVKKRRESIESHYDAEIHFHDPDGDFIGHDALESFSDTLQARFPGQRFELVGEPQTVGDAIRADWQFGPVTGTDFALLEDEKVRSLYAFVRRPNA
jgi:hypothetical protein